MPARDPAERSAVAAIGGTARWAKTTEAAERAAATEAARTALRLRFEREADPDGVLDPADRARRGEALRRAHYARLNLARVQKRRREREAAELAALTALEAEVGGELAASTGP